MDKRRILVWVGSVAAGLEALIAVGGAPFSADAVESYLLTNSVMGIGFAVCGSILAFQRSRNPIGWLLLAAGLAHLTTAAASAILPHWGSRLLVTVFYFAWPWGICLFLPLALQLFPTGRPVSPRWRWLIVVTIAAGTGFAALMATDPTPFPVLSYLGFGLPAALEPPLNAAPLIGFIGAITALIVRYRRGDERTRRQLLWLVLALIAAVALNLPRWVVGDGPILLLLAIALIPAAITIAILRYQLLDIRLVVSRALLYLTLTVAVIAAYVGLVAALDAVLRSAGAPVIATLLIALAFNPVRIWSQRLVDRMFYGSRSDPVGAVSQVGARLAATSDLAGVLEATRSALRLPFAAVRHDGRELASAGQPPAELHAVPLVFHGHQAGELIVGARSGERSLGSADLAVLDLLAAPLAAALEAQASRERIVAAREEERLRLHRDLHDGLGPALTGAAFKADAAQNLVGGSPERAAELMSSLRADLRTAIEDVRRVVYGLRPPALDELGLPGALRRYGESLPLLVTYDLPAAMPMLPAAVEVAAYRIATEALTNVTRHAGAGGAHVTLVVNSALHLSIADDGSATGAWSPGVGLASMRERALELGGTCIVGPTPGGGRVTATLPLEVPS